MLFRSGDELGPADEPGLARGTGGGQDEEGVADHGHLAAQVGDRLAAPEESEVAIVAEGGGRLG